MDKQEAINLHYRKLDAVERAMKRAGFMQVTTIELMEQALWKAVVKVDPLFFSRPGYTPKISDN